MIYIKLKKIIIYIIIEELVNQLQHTYNDSESHKQVTWILEALKQKDKSFSKYLVTFKCILLKIRGLKWADAVMRLYALMAISCKPMVKSM